MHRVCMQSTMGIKASPRGSKNAAKFGLKVGARTRTLGLHHGPLGPVTTTGPVLTCSGPPAPPGTPVLQRRSSSASRSLVASCKLTAKKCLSSFLFQAKPRAARPIWGRSQGHCRHHSTSEPHGAGPASRSGQDAEAQLRCNPGPPAPVPPSHPQARPCALCALRLRVF